MPAQRELERGLPGGAGRGQGQGAAGPGDAELQLQVCGFDGAAKGACTCAGSSERLEVSGPAISNQELRAFAFPGGTARYHRSGSEEKLWTSIKRELFGNTECLGRCGPSSAAAARMR